jgi:two-component system NtrC family response regulator
MLFLDEIGDLSQALQAKLLRFLQERVIERLGGRQEIPVDVRVVCATHRDLAELIRAGTFREDLYYRINEATLRVPPLRERQGDALLLARAFLHRFAAELKRPTVKGFTEAAAGVVEQYAWPGNVRELESRIKRAVIMTDGALISPEDLELNEVRVVDETMDLRAVREAAETRAILRALSHTGQSVAQAAELLGVTRPTLYTLLRKYGIPY